MHGNTFEWCYDVPSSYPTFPTTDWVGEGNAGVRSIRSSSWATSLEATDHRCACRGAEIPDAKCPWFGFRVCLRQFLE
ncbi:MAG: SUMF1/EgtB/PvdO family nonheme iron enzyme [Anaerolineae bacterium]|nr:SUMF1/EgtB/PvdO family nonheme iron enzyme [Anaerolineae bacterium]MBK7200212.1 SUMF1/EgtB/PvdO family nonheme iron enzyme [Anaerolineae bacterium]MBK9094267.1 SUMF1/EgtB/PvdO family nonheme iron enzyme [Anaerolineae bacterium]